MENYKKGKNKNKLRIMYPKNHEHLRTASLGSNFTGSYKKSAIEQLVWFNRNT